MKDSWDGEEDPLVALMEGRKGPFEAFVHAESRTFLGFFHRLGAGRSESEDLVQETFLKLFRLATQASSHAPSGHSGAYESRGQFRGYAFRVARNVWIDRSRKRASEPVGSAEYSSAYAGAPDGADAPSLDSRADPSAVQPEHASEQREESSRIRGAVASLSEGHAQVFELGVVQELPYAEISASLDIPVGTVKSRMFHAIQKVRAALEESNRVAEAIRDRGSRASARSPLPRTNR